ncbi:MAG: hypothetical protein GX471_06650 [Candidatus Microthrix parvicella]|jgi:Tol biopolymer transport system component|uniref:TolB family protein n=1 Tax=Candidatus Neomicrothrix sp. TaxID=2719034 RepID=UPI0016B3C756|nr:hypothetical protein [Candidatus Microthrix sp.]NLH65839.1 hypothetical protein [Candidatus Microthrix parvicella]MBK7018661.1 PD40 domain-containing protein [Candidatus Microthrix sp.]MBP6133582.1 PD40 domain-containing protein [Candidatus Microthrix sp.]MBP6148561.1 PD40 domain-containing protein [Candidatus Microthrix sp.]MBP7985963.1 PD40 domain-containing protein [Candidatus Microthrix sp.]
MTGPDPYPDSSAVGARAAQPGDPSGATHRRGRGCLISAGVLAGLIVLAVVVAVVAIKRFDSAAAVPKNFAPPGSLPGATPLSDRSLAFDSDRTGNFEIFVAAVDDSSAPRQLTDDPSLDSWWPRISPDRRTILFYRAPAGVHDLDATKVSLWAMDADGSNPVELRPAGLDGWTLQGHAEWQPDGTALVMFGGSRLNPQVFITDPTGQQPRQLTDRGGRNIDPAYSSDGRRVWFVGCPKSFCSDGDQEIFSVELNAAGDGPVAEPIRHTNDGLRDNDPYESPDGSSLGWLTQLETDGIGVWDIRLATIDREGRFTSEPRRLMNDSAVTSRPQWSADGASIITHRLEPGGADFDLVRIDVSTGRLEPLGFNSSSNDEYPSL